MVTRSSSVPVATTSAKPAAPGVNHACRSRSRGRSRNASTRGASSRQAGCRREVAAPGPRGAQPVHPLRARPRAWSTLPDHPPRDRIAPRSAAPHERDRVGAHRSARERRRRAAPRPLPRVSRVRSRLPIGRAVWRAHRGGARRHRACTRNAGARQVGAVERLATALSGRARRASRARGPNRAAGRRPADPPAPTPTARRARTPARATRAPAGASRAGAVAARVGDTSDYVAVAANGPTGGALAMRVTYQDPCQLAQAQGIRAEPRALLGRVRGLELIEMAEADVCCGSAGYYNLAQPDYADRLLDGKIDAILATRPDAVVTANPGCMLQLAAGLRARRESIPVLHVVEVLDRAMRSA